jgi:phenylalanyl-tRNA synthetase beta chain
LLPGLLQVVKFNVDHQHHDLNGFEIGRIHFKTGDQYKEQSVGAIVLTGKSRLHHWDRKPTEVDFYDLKGIVENIFKALRINNIDFKPSTLDTLHSGRQAGIYVGSLEVGSFGEVHPAIQRRLDVSQRILFAEFNLHDLLKVRQPEPKMQSIPSYPASERDWTVTLREETPIEQVLTAIRSIPSRLLEKVDIVDLFRSEKLGADKKNATFHFIYRDKEKTVEMEEVEREHGLIVKEALNLLEKW